MRGCTLWACPEGPAPSSPSGCHVGTPTTRGRRRSPLDLGQQQYFATTPKGRPQHLFESVSVAPPLHRQSRGFFGAPAAFGHNKYPPEGARHPRGARRGGRRPFGGGAQRGQEGLLKREMPQGGMGERGALLPEKLVRGPKPHPQVCACWHIAQCALPLASRQRARCKGPARQGAMCLGGRWCPHHAPPWNKGAKTHCAPLRAAARCATQCPPQGAPGLAADPRRQVASL